jgi:threonine dehydrogenase-like Zn-dependent dehydrogenase
VVVGEIRAATDAIRKEFTSSMKATFIHGGWYGPVRAYLEPAIQQVLHGEIDPGKVFDRSVGIDEVPAGYAAMDAREALKVMVTF